MNETLDHEVYLATARRLGWAMRPEVDVPYGELSGDAQELDRAFIRWHEDKLTTLRAENERLVERVRAMKRMMEIVGRILPMTSWWVGSEVDELRAIYEQVVKEKP